MDDAVRALADTVLRDGHLAGLPGQLYIDGAWCDAQGGRRLETFDPGTGRPHAQFAAAQSADVDAAVCASDRAFFQVWRKTEPSARARILARAASLVRRQAAQLAVAESLDSGKRLSEAVEDVQTVAALFDYYAG